MKAVRRPLLVAALLGVVTCALGCILLVSPREGGDHCVFRGHETSCGECLAVRCQAQIDALCVADPAGALPVLEQCAAASDEACDRVPASEAATCLVLGCGDICYPKSGVSQTICEESFLAPSRACSCHADGDTNDLACSKVAFPGTRCCAPPGWPSPGLECTCTSITCTAPGGDGCACRLADDSASGAPLTCGPLPGKHCCAMNDQCRCATRSCLASETEVPACNDAALACPSGTTEVASCSVRF